MLAGGVAVMKTSVLFGLERLGADVLTTEMPGRLVNATEFHKLIVSNRRMERVSCDEVRMRGLRDLDTGEVFLTDERRLFESPR
jgi:hypothetical protein